jgi:hypothetical protein
VGAVEKARSGGWLCRLTGVGSQDHVDKDEPRGPELLEVHGYCGEQGLYFHVFEAASNGSVQSVERSPRMRHRSERRWRRGAVRAFDAPSVSGVDRAFRLAPGGASAAGAEDGGVVCHDVNAPRRCALRQALRLEGTARAIAPVGAIPSPGPRGGAWGEPLFGWAADNIPVRIVFEAFGRKALRALAAGRAHGRDHGFDLAILEGGIDPAHPIRGIGRDSAGSGAEGHFDDIETFLEPARVVLFAGDDLVVPKARLLPTVILNDRWYDPVSPRAIRSR